MLSHLLRLGYTGVDMLAKCELPVKPYTKPSKGRQRVVLPRWDGVNSEQVVDYAWRVSIPSFPCKVDHLKLFWREEDFVPVTLFVNGLDVVSNKPHAVF